jgi:cell division protein FtsA
MAKQYIIAGLDIGTSNIKILIAAKKKGEQKLGVIYQAQEPSFGIRRGVVVDVEKVSRLIQLLLNKVRTENGQKIDSVYVNIGGSHVFCTNSEGVVAVSRADRRVSEEDVKRVLQAAETISLSSNEEILEVIPKEFIIDGKGGIKEAEGMQGGRLEVKVLIVGCFAPYKKNLTQAVLNADLRVSDILPSPLAISNAVLNQKQKELGVAVLDIGAGTSELAVFEEGNLIHLAVFPIGSANITNDIAILLKTEIDIAELIKIKSGSCIFKGNGKKEKIELEEGEVLTFSPKMVAGIIEARVSEIFGEVNKELKKIGKQGQLPAGIVLTGGGANLPKIVELAKKELKLPCRIGKPLFFSDLEDNLSFAVACGLVLRGAEEAGSDSKSLKKIIDKIKKPFQVFIP